jgi:hypothetical protein
MSRPRRNWRWRPLARRVCAALVLVCYCASAVGFPVPTLTDKDRSEPYPCQDHPCGCRTAAECWRQCCCLTPEQRWAWAREQGVQPPPEAEPPSLGWNSPRLRDMDASAHSCCKPRESTSQDAAACKECSPADVDHPAQYPDRSSGPGQRPLGWRSGVAASHCKGTSMLWASAGAVLLPPCSEWMPDSPQVERLSHPDQSAPAVTTPPADPPPRLL